MNKTKVLDCTLRDGGYINQWQFGFENIKRIINGLVQANIDIIECGFLTQKAAYQEGVTRFNTVEQIATVIPKKREGKLYVCMLNYGEYRIEDLPVYDGSSIDGIRVAFHKKNLSEAMEFCHAIKEKGYKVFIQAMVSLNYSDEEFLNLIRLTNQMIPYAFYIVDSFGVMKNKDLIRLFYMVEHNLKGGIFIGYHSHNNMQLAYSNAQSLVNIQTKCCLIIDSSIFGMGRGAGNLNTELFVEYLNDNIGKNYKLKPLLQVIDEVLNNVYLSNYWGYSLPNYLSAAHNCHPNYASYLYDKKTLTIENMDEVFAMMADDKRSNYDKVYIEDLYIRYMSIGESNDVHLTEFKKVLDGKKVLIIAPGKSVEDEKERVITCASSDDIISISINFDYSHYNTDYIFLSNLRRFRELNTAKKGKTIVTSNIPADGVYLQTKYSELLNEIEAVKDNAGMMLIQYLINMGVREVLIAGMDGYSHDADQNFAEQQMAFITKKAVFDAMNEGISKMLTKYSKQIKIKFLTEPRFVKI